MRAIYFDQIVVYNQKKWINEDPMFRSNAQAKEKINKRGSKDKWMIII